MEQSTEGEKGKSHERPAVNQIKIKGLKTAVTPTEGIVGRADGFLSPQQHFLKVLRRSEVQQTALLLKHIIQREESIEKIKD